MDPNIEALTQLGARLALLADAIEDKTRHATRQIEASAKELLQSIESESHAAMNQASQQAMGKWTEQLNHSVESVKWATQALGEQRLVLSRTQQSLIYLGLGSLIIGCLLALGGTWLWAKHYRDEVARLKPEAEFVRALNQADVVLCQDGRLCANIDAKVKRQGNKRQYQPVKPR